MTSEARYDEIADWYETWVEGSAGLITETGELLPADLHGQRVLDVACGHGRASRVLARLGAVVTGVDLAERLVDAGRTVEKSDHLGISYHSADITRSAEWWDGTPFDGAVCEMALMDIDDLAGTFVAVASTLRVGGWFAMSLVHPCFPGNDVGLSSWPPALSYFDEGRWTSREHDPDGVRVRVGSSHRTVSTYLNALIEAGMAIDRVVEPPAPVPTFLLVRSRRIR